jgi:glycosyltransferase involved in cell wall biosynthesis
VIKEMSIMHVVHVAPTVFGHEGRFGGGERYPMELARALAPHVRCEVITFGRNPRTVTEPTGLCVRVLKTRVWMKGHPAHPVAPELPRSLGSADLVHTHHTRSAPSRVAALARLVHGRRIVTTDHGLGGGGWAGLLPRLFAGFLVVSRYSADTLGAPALKTRVVYGGVDPARHRPDPGEPRSGVLYVGRLTPHKGIDRLIEALPTGTPLTIAGSEGHDPRPPERNYPALLRRLASKRDVAFVAAPDDATVARLLRRAAVLALPSVGVTCYGKRVAIPELLSLTVLEAMASGTPVVCSRIGGVPEIVRDGETGFLVEPGNIAELRDRLVEVIRNPSLAARMGRSGRELVMEHFTWDACARRCLDAYDDLVGPAPSSQWTGGGGAGEFGATGAE